MSKTPWEVDIIDGTEAPAPAAGGLPWEADIVDSEGRLAFPEDYQAKQGKVTVTQEPGYFKRTLSALAQGLIGIPEFLNTITPGPSEFIMSGLVDDQGNSIDPKNFDPKLGEPLRQLSQSIDIPATTPFQRYYKTGMQGLGGSVAPGGFAKNAVMSTAGALGGEAAVDVMGEENPLVRMGGNLLAQGPTAAALSKVTPKNVNEIIEELTANIRPDELKAAKEAMLEAKAKGMSLNLDQAMDARSPFKVVIETLAGSRYGDKVQQMLHQQPKELDQLISDALLALPGKPLHQQTITNSVQETANTALRQVKQKAQKAYRDALGNVSDEVSETQVQTVFNRLEALKQKLNTKDTSDYISAIQKRLYQPGELPEFRKSALNIDDNLREEMVGYTPPDRQASAAKNTTKLVNKEIDTILKETIFAPDTPVGKAKAAMRQVMETEYDPLSKSAIGDIAGRGTRADKNAAREAVYAIFNKGTDPDAQGKSSIRQVLQTLRGVNPEVSNDLVRSWLGQKINTLVKLKDDSLDANSAKLLYDGLYANKAMRTGVQEMLAETAQNIGKSPQEVKTAFNGFMRVVERAGKRPEHIGAMSAQELNALAKNSPLAEVFRLQGWLGNIRAAGQLEKRILGKTLSRLDELMTDPEGVDTILKIKRDGDLKLTTVEKLGKVLMRLDQAKEQSEQRLEEQRKNQ